MTRVVFEGSFDELASLEDWLRDAGGLRGRTRLRPGRPAAGRMGGEPPDLVVDVASQGQATTLARTVEFWLRTRGRQVALRLRVGSEITVDLDLLAKLDTETLVAQVTTLLRDALDTAAE
ncbi:effector-associated constant component EACC1 [Nonomuraea sp. NPDC004354]|uniref:effector-associated constant component EACC1 n=1 Tax=Nonomuraea sp. NPDC003804 TaxID=3154547 RepID=UPI0033A0F228